MAGKIIEVLVLLLGLVLTAAIVVSIPMKSYNEYKDYLAQIEEQNEANKQAAIKPKLESITVELKEGVKYFANDMAEAKVEDFIVVANYTKGEESYSEPVEEGKFSVSTGASFYSEGGDITVTYRGVSAVVNVALEPVVLESISVDVTPYTIKYAAGSTFDKAGMILTAVYNDGTSKVLSEDQYVVDTETVLAVGDEAVTVSFTDGEVTKTVDIEIGVSETLDNGAVKSIVIVDGAIVNAGDVIANASMEVNAVYENGNRIPLSGDQYTISASLGAVEFGKMYELTVSYNADPTKTASTDIVVRQTLQGEDGTIVGGSKKTEDEYAVIDGVITKLGNTVSFAGNFSQTVLKGGEAHLTLELYSASQTVGNITMRCSNSYNVYANGSNADGGYMMKPLQINTILDLTINGREVKVPATVILRGCGPYESYAPLYGIYYEFTFEDIELDAGINNVKFNFKRSTVGATNCWGESPSTLNIDYVHFDSLGSEIPEEYDIKGLEIGQFTAEYAQKFSDVKVPVIAILDNGTKIGISSDLYDLEFTGGPEGVDYFKFGTYTVKATLKDNPAITATGEVTIEEFEHFVVLKAGVEIVDGRVYYVFSGDSVGYAADDLEFFDGSRVFENVTVEFTDTTFVMKIDVTGESNGTIYPHLRVEGANYDNGGANANGDIRDRGLTYTNGQSVSLNGKTYKINTAYSMPTLVISGTSVIPTPPPSTDGSYDANLDNSFASDKDLLGEYLWGSEGVTVSGGNKSNDDEYVNGIGGLDKANRGVTYTFTVDADGKVDFIWNVAGNKWNSGTNSNDGITDMASHMIVTIDGKAVDVSGIALPAGSGTAAQVWWNLQQVVIKDVQLTAGVHTFKCVITTDGAGLNVGAMEIYSSAN